MKYTKWNPDEQEKEEFFDNTTIKPANYSAGIFIAAGESLDDIDCAAWGDSLCLAILLQKIEEKLPPQIKEIKDKLKVKDNGLKRNGMDIKTPVNYRIH